MIALISVKHAKRRHTGAFHDDGFIKGDSTGKAPPQISAVFFDSVVIAKDHEETALIVEFLQNLIDFLMGIIDVGKSAVFPQFITIAKFYVGEILLIVVF